MERRYLNRSTVQINVRIPLSLRLRVDEYLEYMGLPERRRTPASINWPDSVTALIQTALEEFLANHPQKLRTGRAARPPVQAKPKKQLPKQKDDIDG